MPLAKGGKEMEQTTKKLTLSAMFMALGFVLPFLTGQMQQLGSMLLPMHLPVFFCGLICGWQYGAVVGFVLPLLRSVVFGMPPLFPTAVGMAFELMVYGLVSGLLYGRSKRQCLFTLYGSLLAAMAAGRIVWGAVQIILLGISGSGFTWEMFMASAFFNAIPGIILQLTMIPAVMAALNRTGLVPYRTQPAACQAEQETENV